MDSLKLDMLFFKREIKKKMSRLNALCLFRPCVFNLSLYQKETEFTIQ